LADNLPNMPTLEEVGHRIVRVNDGNDSNNDRDSVMKACEKYSQKFYNTSIPHDLENFKDPVVLTVNPGRETDGTPVLLDPIPKNLMFVRVRTNTWNIENVVDPVVKHYTARGVPVVLTFMAYYEEQAIPDGSNPSLYTYRKRTLNSYWAITTAGWESVMLRYMTSDKTQRSLVYSCGKVEGELGTTRCSRCGNCLREYFVTKERLLEQKT